MTDKLDPDWIALDWGSTRLRAYAMSRTGETLGRLESKAGAVSLSKDEFEPALLDLITGWLGSGRKPVIACGMVGSRQGWVEASYLSVPTAPRGEAFVRAPVKDSRLQVFVMNGICQETPPDVMRGEETQIAGYLASSPDFDGIICLPGTHSKWVHVVDKEIFHFNTFLTGELFALLAEKSVLRHSVSDTGFDRDVFLDAFDDTITRPEAIGAKLFGLRAGGLLQTSDPVKARSRLSGYLIGLELAGAKPYWLGQNLVLIGANAIVEAYAAACSHVGLNPQIMNGTDAVLAGLTAAYSSMKETV